jgi:hypothetical protein
MVRLTERDICKPWSLTHRLSLFSHRSQFRADLSTRAVTSHTWLIKSKLFKMKNSATFQVCDSHMWCGPSTYAEYAITECATGQPWFEGQTDGGRRKDTLESQV